MAIKLVNAGLGFATITLFARFLPPETYGLYVLALTLAQFLALPLQMGLPTLMNREISIAMAEGRPGVVLGLQIWARRIVMIGTLLVGGALIAMYSLVVAAGWPILQEFTWPLVLMVVVLIPVIAEMKLAMGALTGFKRVVQGRLPDGLVRPVLVLSAGGAGLAFASFGATELLGIYVASAGVAACVGIWLVHRVVPEAVRKATPEIRAQDWWRALGSLTAFVAAGSIKTYADILMLGAMVDTATVAHYRVAVQIGSLAMLVQLAVQSVLGPWMASIGEGGFVRLLGPAYADVYYLALWLAVGQAGSTFFGGTVILLNMTRRENLSARYATWTAIANIALNASLIPFFGAMGAVCSTILTTLAMQAMAWNRLRTDIGVRSDVVAQTERTA
jgi:O-antigen/teichoic acid export membrane protein